MTEHFTREDNVAESQHGKTTVCEEKVLGPDYLDWCVEVLRANCEFYLAVGRPGGKADLGYRDHDLCPKDPVDVINEQTPEQQCARRKRVDSQESDGVEAEGERKEVRKLPSRCVEVGCSRDNPEDEGSNVHICEAGGECHCRLPSTTDAQGFGQQRSLPSSFFVSWNFHLTNVLQVLIPTIVLTVSVLI
jgi:hypothetical protein